MIKTRHLSLDEAARLGQVLRQRRDALGLSRDRLARLIDLSSSRIQQYERGWTRQYDQQILSTPPEVMLDKLAEVLGTTTADLLAEAKIGTEASSDRVHLHIEASQEEWRRFVDTLPPAAKDQLLTMFTNGEVKPDMGIR